MISVESAIHLIKKHMPDFGESPDVLMEDLIADRDYPPFDRVMMDGIAVNFNVFSEGKRDFKIAGVCPAGEPEATLSDFSNCFEVMTGAPLPHGADLVIPYEHIEMKDGMATVTTELTRTHLENVHLKGSDAKKGDLILKRGETLNGPHWGIATSLGYSNPSIKCGPKINIISTGDELVAVDETPLDHQIRRSNAYALKASLKAFGYDDVELSHLPDKEAQIEKHYRENAAKFDLMIYSGGVSKGKFDYLPETWKKLGVQEIFHGISQRPGKPLWFGIDEKNKTTVFGLPGNPVSSLVSLHRYFLSRKEIYAELTEEIIFKKDMTYFVPVKLHFKKNGTLSAEPLKIKNSGEFSALAGSDGFIELPKEQSVFAKGTCYLFHPWRNL